jgi:arylsulfatase A-like enzyme
MKSKRPLSIASAVLLLCTMAAAETRQPNIVLIYTDDLGYGDVTPNGAKAGLTPHLSKLAQQGLNFTDAHCTSATCTPSRFSLLTGSYAFRQQGTGIARGNANMVIRPGTTTLPSLLQTVGYKTGVVGKWHLGLGEGEIDWNEEVTPGPREIGFDYHFLIPATGDRTPCVYLEQGRVVDHDPADPIKVSYGKRIDDSPSGKERPDLLKQMWSHGHNQTIVNGISRIGWMTGGEKARWVDEDMADMITHKAVEWIEENKDESFFLYFSTHDIHVPRVPHSRFEGTSGMGPRGDAIVQMDWCVGELMAALDRLDLADDTVVIFTSDNGPVLDDGYVDFANEKLGDHDPSGPLRAGKYSKFEGGTRVPMIVRWPGHIDEGTTSDALVGQIDFARTLADLTGAAVPDESLNDSQNALAAILGKPTMGRAHLVEETYAGLAIRVGNWKFIPGGGTRDNLGPWVNIKVPKGGLMYELNSDLGETENLAAKQPERAAEMNALLEEIKARGHDRAS